MIQWIPGADSPENQSFLKAAKDDFLMVLQKDRSNPLALASLASMAYNSAFSGTAEQKTASLEEAKKWNQRRIEANPEESEAYYYLGVISWSQSFTPIQTEKNKEKMRPEEMGPLKDGAAKGELASKYWKTINDGIKTLNDCLKIDNENEDAMSYMNLLLRLKATLEDSAQASKADVSEAEQWAQKAVDMKKLKAARPIAR